VIDLLSEAGCKAASDLLLQHWDEGRRLAALPDEIRPATRAEGYAIQGLVEGRSAEPLFGWKIAATSAAGQKHINVDGPLAGRLLREKAFPNGASIPLGANAMRVAEAEFAFRMARELPPRASPYALAEVAGAIGALHPAIEIPDSRYEDFTAVGAPQLIADNACAHLFVLGDPVPDLWRGVDLVAHRVIGQVLGRIEWEGRGANVLAGPLDALTWLVNELSGLGLTLNAGEIVTTGTCVVPMPIRQGDKVEANFGVLGRVEVGIT
jgi:2-keto-4-pentenoate hydratase